MNNRNKLDIRLKAQAYLDQYFIAWKFTFIGDKKYKRLVQHAYIINSAIHCFKLGLMGRMGTILDLGPNSEASSRL